MILNGLMLIFSGALCVICGVFGQDRCDSVFGIGILAKMATTYSVAQALLPVLFILHSQEWLCHQPRATAGTPAARSPKTEQGQRGLALME
jgi:hypothetical protein